MSGATGMPLTVILGLAILFLLWIILVRSSHALVALLRHEPLIGWAIGPLGITVMSLHEPSALFIWFDALLPALVSGCVVYIGLFTSFAPIELPHRPLVEILTVALGVLITSIGDLLKAVRDLHNPLWGEARILRSIQQLHASWAKIHFTPFGYSYIWDHFGSNPSDLLQAL